MHSDSKITTITAVLMLICALGIDVTQALLDLLDLTLVLAIIVHIINWILDIMGGIGFFIWLKSHGVQFVSAKRILSFFGPLCAEFFPIVDALPLWGLGIILTVLSVWAEESIYILTGFEVSINNSLANMGSKNTKRKGSGNAKLPSINNMDKQELSEFSNKVGAALSRTQQLKPMPATQKAGGVGSTIRAGASRAIR